MEEFHRFEVDIRKLRHDNETVARQSFRPFVLRDGDKNTAFFQSKMALRRKCNRLKGLKDKISVL